MDNLGLPLFPETPMDPSNIQLTMGVQIWGFPFKWGILPKNHHENHPYFSGMFPYKSSILGGSSHLVSGLVHPSYKVDIAPTSPIYNQGKNQLTIRGMNHQVYFGPSL